MSTETIKANKPNLPKAVVSHTVAVVSSCQVCGSERRTDYEGIREHSHDGVVTQWKNCGCLDCGQRRTDIFRTKMVESL